MCGRAWRQCPCGAGLPHKYTVFYPQGFKKIYNIFRYFSIYAFPRFFFNSPGVLAPRRGGMGRRKTGAGGRPLRVRENGNWFSERLPHMGERKKLVARISKSEPLILKSKPLIFCSLKTRPAGAGDQLPFGRISVCLLAPKMRTKRRHAPAGAGCRENIYPMIKINGNIVETRFIASLQGWFVGRSPVRCRATRPNAH